MDGGMNFLFTYRDPSNVAASLMALTSRAWLVYQAMLLPGMLQAALYSA